jgi:hypothetical protein
MDFIALSAAAAMAQRRVFAPRGGPSLGSTSELLDLIALGISTHVRVYGGGARRPISVAELQRGVFRGGGTRFVIEEDGLVVDDLVVSRTEFERALDQLATPPYVVGLRKAS